MFPVMGVGVSIYTEVRASLAAVLALHCICMKVKKKKEKKSWMCFSLAALVPDSVKKELLHRIRAFLAQHAT